MPGEALIILCGDLNFPRASPLYEELVMKNGLTDPLRDDPRPTYRPFPLVPSQWKTSLDYILYRLPHEKNFQTQADIILVEDASQKNIFRRFLSDHCALKLNISITS
jgi:endonuclease/exonuclease/phosphatase family metal-dependent hydrolase